MDIKNIYTVILLIFVWLVGATITIMSLYCKYGITAILGVTAPYYLTKFLLVKEYNSEKGEV